MTHKDQISQLRAELALRTMKIDFLIEVPREHRVHGQHAAFTSGVEAAWRGWERDNPYMCGRAQYRAWEAGYLDGIMLFANMFAKCIRERES